MRVLRLAPFAILPLLLLACVGDAPPAKPLDGGSDTGPGDAGAGDTSSPGDANGPSATLKLTPGAPFLRVGTMLDATVDITRNGVTGPITLVPSGAGAGVTITVAPVGDGTITTQMKVTAAMNAAVGSFPIKLSAPGVTDFTFTLLVGDPPATLDKSFDGDGIVLDAALPNGSFNAVVAQSDGKIIVAGNADAGSSAWLLRRYGIDGARDMAFETASAAILPKGGVPRGVAIDPKGRIVIVGNTGGSPAQLALVRLNPDGSPDQSFDADGVVNTATQDFGTGFIGNAIAFRMDSSIVVGGRTEAPHGMILHFLEDGSRDTGFTAFTTGMMNASGNIGAIWSLPQGEILAAGTDLLTNPVSPLLVRLQANGLPDMNFGTAGRKSFEANAGGCTGSSGGFRTTSGDVIITGVDNQNVGEQCEVRVTAAGAFSWVQRNGTNAGNSGGGTPTLSDGSYSVGWYGGSQTKHAYVKRRVAGGALDPTFGGGEIDLFDTQLPQTYYIALAAVTTLPDRRVVTVGQRRVTSTGPVIYRYWF